MEVANQKEIENTLVEVALSNIRSAQKSGELTDALGLLGVILDCYPENILLRQAAQRIVSELANSPLKTPHEEQRIGRLRFQLLSEEIGETKRYYDHLEALPSAPHLDATHLQTLMRALQSDDLAFRRRAIQILEQGTLASKELLPILLSQLNSSDAAMRSAVTEIFSLRSDLAKLAIQPLAAALADSQVSVRANAARALGNADTEALAALPALLDALADDQAIVRLRGVEALGRLGAVARDAVPALQETLRDRETIVREKASWALGQIGSLRAAQALIIATHDEQEPVRRCAVHALRTFYNRMQSAIRNTPSAPLSPSNEEFIDRMRITFAPPHHVAIR